MKLPVLILYPHSRCNCRCTMCDIWKTTDSRDMKELPEIENLGVEWVVFSGGEPLMNSNLFELCAPLKARGIRRTLLSSGLLLRRYAEDIVEWIDDVIVSLDGPPAVHDRIRGVPGAFQSIDAGVKTIRALRPDFPITARCTVQRLNSKVLVETVEASRALGLNGISFLAADVTSDAFNRPGGWDSARQAQVAADAVVLEEEIERLIQIEPGQSPEKLRRIVRQESAPTCNAPWVSAVVETDGTVRPCFFHPPIGKIGEGTTLGDVVNGPAAVAFREQLDVATDPVCQNCVCSLNWRPR